VGGKGQANGNVVVKMKKKIIIKGGKRGITGEGRIRTVR
jgi:hypothetical protein